MNKYKVWREEDGETIEDAREYEAYEESYAAEKWVKDYDKNSGEYAVCAGNEEVIVKVLEEGRDKPVKFTVHGWCEPTYLACGVWS